MNDEIREQFEKEYGKHWNFKRNPGRPSVYIDRDTQLAWEGYLDGYTGHQARMAEAVELLARCEAMADAVVGQPDPSDEAIDLLHDLRGFLETTTKEQA